MPYDDKSIQELRNSSSIHDSLTYNKPKMFELLVTNILLD